MGDLSTPTPEATSNSTTSTTSIGNVFASIFAPNNSIPSAAAALSLTSPLYLSNNGASSIFSGPDQHEHCHYAPSPQQQPAMSATALLQKAAQMGAAASNTSLLRGLGLAVSSSSSSTPSATAQDPNVDSNSMSRTAGVGLELPSNGTTSGFTDHTMMFGNEPTTLDLLGLGLGIGIGMGAAGLLTSFGGGFNVVAPTTETWEGPHERKPNPSPML